MSMDGISFMQQTQFKVYFLCTTKASLQKENTTYRYIRIFAWTNKNISHLLPTIKITNTLNFGKWFEDKGKLNIKVNL